MDACEFCDDSGIVGVIMKGFLGDSVPVTCACQVGQNALAANPTWETARNVDAPGIGRTEGLEI